MSRYGLIVNVDKCIGCMACFVACKEENKVAPGIQWNQIHRNENIKAQIINYYRVSCMHCGKPACLPVCPPKAIHRGANGKILVNQFKCIGCKMCLAACPYGVPKFNETGRTNYFETAPLTEAPKQPHQVRPAGRAERCTLYTHRTKEGMLPKCVEVCPPKALVFVNWDQLKDEQKALAEKAVALNAAAGTEPKVRYVSTWCNISEIKDKMA